MIAEYKLKVTICGVGHTDHLAVVLFSQNPKVDVTFFSSQPKF
ncbi:hypothetical protein ARAF_1591 [Arsenophonus endosymbiont of Aleurodicus floccissimus]|nr:hypothetical protein ARAF_1591 [Arsenophonus endosymbiont of Aleurodicus floccissimus]